ncbi:MAG: hypothetical protein EOO38_01420 [Cytophagaceae bacterium]|nr:MAG: hypothetical protein EOO38_01420 [Cytophagaceae bacterium]
MQALSNTVKIHHSQYNMFHLTTRRTPVLALALAFCPLIVAGCGGGNSGVVQPTATPTSTSPASTGLLDVNLTNQSNVTVPATLRTTQTTGQLYTQSGSTNVQLGYQGSNQSGAVQLQLGKTGAIATGDVFTLVASSTSAAPLDNNLSYTLGGETYIAISGTCTINSVTTNTTTGRATVQFTLANVQLRGLNNPNSTFALAGRGNATVPTFTL